MVTTTRSTRAVLFGLLAPLRRRLVIGAVAGVVWMTALAAIPLVLGQTVDAVLAGGGVRSVAPWCAMLAVAFVLEAASGAWRHWFAVHNGQAAAIAAARLVAERLERLGHEIREHRAPGDLAALASGDAGRIGTLADLAARGTGAVVSLLIVAVVLAIADPALAAVAIGGTLGGLVVSGPLLRPLIRWADRQQEDLGAAAARTADLVLGARVLRGVGGVGVAQRRITSDAERVRQSAVGHARWEAIALGVQTALPGLVLVAILWVGGRLAVTGAITPGEFVAFYGLVAAFLAVPVGALLEVLAALGRGVAAGRRVAAFAAIRPRRPVGRDDGPRGVLAVRSSLVDLAPPAGAFTVVRCGPDVDSAHVAAVLSGLEPPPDGTSVLGGGVPLAAVDRDALRRHVGAGAGEARLLRGPLRDDLLAGRADRAQRLDRALWAACADEALEHVPGGLDGDVHDRGWSLSGGQRQRFALARLLAADPDVLVLHDPTSAVDAHTEALIACRLREARRGRTTIVVSRSALLAEVADRVVELSAERR